MPKRSIGHEMDAVYSDTVCTQTQRGVCLYIEFDRIQMWFFFCPLVLKLSVWWAQFNHQGRHIVHPTRVSCERKKKMNTLGLIRLLWRRTTNEPLPNMHSNIIQVQVKIPAYYALGWRGHELKQLRRCEHTVNKSHQAAACLFLCVLIVACLFSIWHHFLCLPSLFGLCLAFVVLCKCMQECAVFLDQMCIILFLFNHSRQGRMSFVIWRHEWEYTGYTGRMWTWVSHKS